MIRLLPNTAGNIVYLTLKEKDKDLGTVSNYLMLLEHQISRQKYYLILDTNEDNERYTEATIDTNTDAPASGNILLTETGLYWYFVYGQNSDSNLDPDNAVGLFQKGVCNVKDSEATYFDVPDITQSTDTIYYEG
jgi:hypothetical protein